MDNLEYIKEKADKLIAEAKAEGVIVTIELKDLEPLVMGNYEMISVVRKNHPY